MFMLKNVVQNKFVIWHLFLHHCTLQLKNVKNSKLVRNTLKSRTLVQSEYHQHINRSAMLEKQFIWAEVRNCSVFLHTLRVRVAWKIRVVGLSSWITLILLFSVTILRMESDQNKIWLAFSCNTAPIVSLFTSYFQLPLLSPHHSYLENVLM